MEVSFQARVLEWGAIAFSELWYSECERPWFVVLESLTWQVFHSLWSPGNGTSAKGLKLEALGRP